MVSSADFGKLKFYFKFLLENLGDSYEVSIVKPTQMSIAVFRLLKGPNLVIIGSSQARKSEVSEAKRCEY